MHSATDANSSFSAIERVDSRGLGRCVLPKYSIDLCSFPELDRSVSANVDTIVRMYIIQT